MRALVFTPEAFDDLRRACHWYDAPYHAYFTADDRRLTVLLVFHTAQDPAKVFGRLTSH